MPPTDPSAALLDLPFPVLCTPGNHDRRAAFRKALLGEPGAATPINRAYDIAGVRILMCDSSIPGRADGVLTHETLTWITETLDGPQTREDPATTNAPGRRPAVLAFHHPPVAVHHPFADGIRLGALPSVADLLARHPQIIALITGHTHGACAATFAGRPVLIGPVVTFALRMPWQGPEHADWDQPPGVAFHVIDENGPVTHFRSVT